MPSTVLLQIGRWCVSRPVSTEMNTCWRLSSPTSKFSGWYATNCKVESQHPQFRFQVHPVLFLLGYHLKQCTINHIKRCFTKDSAQPQIGSNHIVSTGQVSWYFIAITQHHHAYAKNHCLLETCSKKMDIQIKTINISGMRKQNYQTFLKSLWKMIKNWWHLMKMSENILNR